MISASLAILVLIGLAAASPFLIWRSFLVVLRCTLTSPHIDRRSRLSLLRHLSLELAQQPVLTLLWWIDEVFFRAYRGVKIDRPTFIVGQPRSGTTLLLKTLAADEENFFSLQHLEMRYPFIVLWKIYDLLGIRGRLEAVDYWPSTELGRLASRLHEHKLGFVEEHGMFFEERMYHHYFTFRRFPFLEVLDRVSDVGDLTQKERDRLVGSLARVVQKVAHHRGRGRSWLTKEVENADAHRLLRDAFPDARFIVILRPPEGFVSSFRTMCYTCTTAKHGIDPDRIPGWFDANMGYRRDECRRFEAFCRDLERDRAVEYIAFDLFTTQLRTTVEALYGKIGRGIGAAFDAYLLREQRAQDGRDAGYRNEPQDVSGFDPFGRFVAERGSWSAR